jgi:hypothetical protein
MPNPFIATCALHEILRRSQRAARVARPKRATVSFLARFTIPDYGQAGPPARIPVEIHPS